ncbi:MAG: signal peptidase I [Firmicutes bacterium]|nr:signal peptidase I [Bacillota bacterium]
MDWLEIKEFFKDTFKYIVFIFVVIFIAVYIVGLQQVVGPSMAPTFENGNILILDKVTYRFSEIKRNDVVSLYYADTKYLIKRVIGMPGEKVEYRNGDLYINDRLVKEEFLTNAHTSDFSLSDLGYSVIPEDMYFVVGDNRNDSLDSRDPDVGLIPKEDIIGKVRIRLWPINQIKIVK